MSDHIDGEQARRRLESERERVTGLISSLRGEIGDSSETEELGDLSGYDQHPADQGSETFEREKDLSILEGLESDLAEIEAALQRLDDGTYGIDEITGKPISAERLDAIPTARTDFNRDSR